MDGEEVGGAGGLLMGRVRLSSVFVDRLEQLHPTEANIVSFLPSIIIRVVRLTFRRRMKPRGIEGPRARWKHFDTVLIERIEVPRGILVIGSDGDMFARTEYAVRR